MKLIGQFDIKDTTGFNTGLDSLKLPADQPPVVFQFTDALGNTQPDTMKYHYFIRGLRDGFKYYMAVTSYDTGNQRVEPLESGKTQNSMEAIPGPNQAQASGQGVVVFPNPYRVEARWDYGQFAQDHFLWFANLPPKCRIRIYTLGGDLVQDVNYDASNYHGLDARGVYSVGRDFGIDPPTLSGSMWAWNLITRFNQAVASGLYLYSVEDPSGKRQVGKFVVIKSDIQQ